MSPWFLAARCRELLNLGIPIAAFVAYSAIGIAKYDLGRSGNFDLGIFSQAAKAWSTGHLPSSSIRELNTLFADHFSPITGVFGLSWLIWPDPRTLVVAQALAMAAAIGIICREWLRWQVSVVAVTAVALIVFSRGMIAAAYFDVHEVGLGVVAMTGLCCGLHRRNRALVWCSALVLILVKEDLGLTVAAAGIVWWLRTRDRRTAGYLVAVGLLAVAAAFMVVYLASGSRSIYVGSLTGDATNPLGLTNALPATGNRFAPALLFALTAGLIGLRSPMALLAAPTLAWRFISSNPVYWQTYFHYDLLLVPIAAFALLDALAQERGDESRNRRRGKRAVVLIGLLWAAQMGLTKATTLPLTSPASYQMSATRNAAQALSELIPEGAPVAAQQELGPGLIDRLDVHMLSSARPVTTRWVMLTAAGSSLGASEHAKRGWLKAMIDRPGVRMHTMGAVTLVELPRDEAVQLGS